MLELCDHVLLSIHRCTPVQQQTLGQVLLVEGFKDIFTLHQTRLATEPPVLDQEVSRMIVEQGASKRNHTKVHWHLNTPESSDWIYRLI